MPGTLTLDGRPVTLADDGLPDGMPSDHGIATLGWGVLAWGEAFLAQPDGDRAGQAWEWTATQARLVAWWYAVARPSGRWLWRRGQIVLPKGAGKSPLAAALSCCALAAEVVFDRFDASGEAVGRPHPSPHVQLAAVSQDQTDNTMSLVLAMLGDGEAANTIAGLDLGLTRVRTRNGKLEPVTASAPSREGQRLSDAVLDEPHLWTDTNGGTRLAATLRRNLGKTGGRSLETTNAWMPGEDSVAEQTAAYADKIAEGKTVDVGLMRYHPKAVVADLADAAQLRHGLEGLYADAPWVDIDRIIAEVYDLGTHPADARRYYLNEITSADDAWLVPREWDACTDPDLRLNDDDTIALGFDGSLNDDATALVAARLDDGAVFLLGCWERPDGPPGNGWEVPRDQVNDTVDLAFDRYDVAAFYADLHPWESYVDAWAHTYGPSLIVKASSRHAVAWDMRVKQAAFTYAAERFHNAVLEQAVRHDGNRALARHVANARRRPNRWGVSISKDARASTRKIDAAVTAVLAWQARLDAQAVVSGRARRTGRVYGFA